MTAVVHTVSRPDGSPWAFVVIDSLARGPAFGGIRRARYATVGEALADARRLARAMSRKCALAELPAGGAKSVIAWRDGDDAAEIYRRVGELVESLGGDYVCGPDVGTGVAELELVRQVTRHVNPPANDASRSTARGVRAGLDATLEVACGSPSPRGRRILVQGLGGVGLALARDLLTEGAHVAGIEIDAARARAARDAGVERAEPDDLELDCDLFAPCALGGVLTPDVAARLRARAVCGSANNVLADEAAGEVLHRRGVLLAPDIVVSAGAVIEGVLTVLHGDSPDTRARIDAAIAAIGPRTRELLQRSRREDTPPTGLAHALADQVSTQQSASDG